MYQVLCRYVDYGHKNNKSMDQPDKVANPARSQLNREKELINYAKENR